MTYPELLAAAQGKLGDKCRVCPVCNGLACRSAMPGPGAKGTGSVSARNYAAWQDIRVNMDCLVESAPIDTSLSLFGRTFAYPFFAGPVGAVQLHYSALYDDVRYNEVLVRACAASGIAAFTGDGTDPNVMTAATAAIAAADGAGVPTVKPWNRETIAHKMAQVHASGCFAVAMDIDASGLPFLQNLQPPAGAKSTGEMREIIAMAEGKPFVIKGIMTAKSALRAAEAGAYGIIVSNHGGRVLDGCPATAEVLPEIADALAGSGVKVLVDGGIRTGLDIFKALALGADAVLIARPFVTAVYGGADEGVAALVGKYSAELRDTMMMCGARSLADITRDMIRLPR